MAKTPHRIAKRILTIAAAQPVIAADPPPKPASKKREQRRPVYRHGQLRIAGGVMVDCIIVDISPNGARVELDSAFSLPEFVLLKTVMTGERRRARVVWKNRNSAGLSFLLERKAGFSRSGEA